MSKIEIEDLEKSKDPKAVEIANEMLADDRARREQMSPAGSLGLPEILDAQRLKYGIPDGFFRRTPMFDRVLVFQIELVESDKYEGTMLYRPESTRAREKQEACRGIIVAAGLLALDQLISNGSGLGHTVIFIKQAPWRVPMAHIRGKPEYALLLNAGDICADETLNAALSLGERKLNSDINPDGVLEHYYTDNQGTCGKPLAAYQPGGY